MLCQPRLPEQGAMGWVAPTQTFLAVLQAEVQGQGASSAGPF